jgi:hypothetical protein
LPDRRRTSCDLRLRSRWLSSFPAGWRCHVPGKCPLIMKLDRSLSPSGLLLPKLTRQVRYQPTCRHRPARAVHRSMSASTRSNARRHPVGHPVLMAISGSARQASPSCLLPGYRAMTAGALPRSAGTFRGANGPVQTELDRVGCCTFMLHSPSSGPLAKQVRATFCEPHADNN